jgi:hypothetical protein
MDELRTIKRTLLRVAIVALCITAAIAIVAVVTASFGETEGRILFTHVLVAVYCLLALAATAVGERQPALAGAGLASCAAGLTLGVIETWADPAGYTLLRWAFLFFVASFTFAHSALIESRRRDSDGPAVRALSIATIATGAVLGATIAVALAAADDVSDAFLRVVGVLAVLDLLGTAVLPIARKIERAATDR